VTQLEIPFSFTWIVKRSTTFPRQYTVSIRITTFVRDLEIAWTIEHP